MNHDEINHEEAILRRIPVSQNWYNPATLVVADPAYSPQRFDTDGLSVSRAKSSIRPEFLSPEEFAAIGRSHQGYFVAELRAADLFAHGFTLIHQPVENDPGHSLILELTYENRRTDESKKLIHLLARRLTIRIHGKFSGAPITE